MSLVCQLPVLHSDYLTQMPSFLALRLLHTYAHYHPNMGSKWWPVPKCSHFARKCTFEALLLT